MDRQITGVQVILLMVWMMFLTASANAASGGNVNVKMSYIQNKHIRLGVDLSIGGSVTYLSKRGGPNMINSHDWGRQIQMSFYSGPSPYEPEGHKPHANWAGLGWNPIQSGDCYHHRSKVLEYRNDGDSIYVKCRPMQWPLNDYPGHCIFETWYTLKGDRVCVRSRLTNERNDKTQYHARTQELPAIYTNGPWYKLVAYKGDKPFTGEKPTVIVGRDDHKGWPWRNFYTSEQWVALLDDDNNGIGVYEPGAYQFTGGFAGAPKGKGGPKSGQTGYMAPTIPGILDHNIVYTYQYMLIVGSLDEIRHYVYQDQQNRRLPHWDFKTNRANWIYTNITDEGWPIDHGLKFQLGPKDAVLKSPKTFWEADKAPAIRIRASFKTQAHTARVELLPYDQLDAGDWAQWGPENKKRPKPAAPVAIDFPIQGDGVMRDMTINLADCPAYRGAMTQINLQLPQGTGQACIESVELVAGK